MSASGGKILDEWVEALRSELGLEVEVDIRELLALARDAAHNVDRPAAPLTTYLVGYAAGAAGGDTAAVNTAMSRAAELAARWAHQNEPDQPEPDQPEGRAEGQPEQSEDSAARE